MTRWWGSIVWTLVAAIAFALALQTVLIRDATGRAEEARVAAETGLRLNEILAGPARDWDGDGAYDARGDEWVEIQNAGAVPLPMDAYRLADADGTVRFALTGALQPGELALVTGSAAVAWQRSVGLTATGLSLNNSGDVVFLLRVGASDTTVADSHSYGTIEGGSDRSVGRAMTGTDDWILFDALNRYTGSGSPSGSGCAPTPASPNGCTTDVRSTTWGAIKKLYR